jgi:hypothetical protein
MGVPLKQKIRDQIVAFGVDGIPASAIRRRLLGRVSISMIYEALAEARAAGQSIPLRNRSGDVTDDVRIYHLHIRSEAVVLSLTAAAARRHISPHQLVTELVAAAARDNLIDAVLDDG